MDSQTVRIHYHRSDGIYESWGLHVWGDTEVPTSWQSPLTPAGLDDFGLYWDVAVKSNGNADFLIHKEDIKDCTGSITCSMQQEIWMVSENEEIFKGRPDLACIQKGSLSLARAYWVKEDLFAWPSDSAGDQFYLHASKSANLSLSSNGVEGADTVIKLEKDSGLPLEVIKKLPHLKGYVALRVPPSCNARKLVKTQLAIAVSSADGLLLDASGIQLSGVLDDLFAYDGPLGVVLTKKSVTLHLWAPTAQHVKVLLYSSPSGGDPEDIVELYEMNGTWTVHGQMDWLGKFYLFEVTVFHPLTQKIEKSIATDPYSRGLSANGERSLILDLDDEATKPEEWDKLALEKPALKELTDIAVYELHIRDFSIADESVDPLLRGTYLAFTSQNSAGVRHLKELAEAGLTHVHLLPSYDFASVDEIKENWKFLDEKKLAALPPDSDEQQAAVAMIKDTDGFNWGYDPVNWGVPEGSYATDPNSSQRSLEFRAMIQALNRLGLRVILDVVYNHLYGSGPHDRYSVLDKVVPGYYLRRNTSGEIENSTCMNNTASEYYMVDRLIVDDLKQWAVNYKVDGFRFDLMGHLMKSTMVRAKNVLQSLTKERDGVDGSKIYLYGEGWDFGEVAGNKRGKNAAQCNLAGTGIGSFNDRIRDSALGGSPFADPRQQGFLTGLFLKPNGFDQGDKSTMRSTLAATTDWIRAGLAGNLKDFVFTSCNGEEVKGMEILTNDGRPVAYAASPQETINYVSAHDNETLFDTIMLKTARDVSLQDRCRINHLASSIVALSQGIPFFHAGDDLLRSKSLDRDSYNSGDWFNRLDFTYESNNWGVGLPPKEKNGSKWEIMRDLLSDRSLKATKSEIIMAKENFKTLLKIRFSSPLFRLPTTHEVQARLRFHNTGPNGVPGVIVMSIVDGDDGHGGLQQVDPLYRSVVVLFNACPTDITITVPLFKARQLYLHPSQASSFDEILKQASFQSTIGVFGIPARTTAVFVEPRHS